ncbi:DUF2867 domain-containing protein [Stappia sp. BW2]|uniref:DUF2867 domain-containing protein n=1 Tax=Stappia sp. BW2 TaxID=2592622 RepID=UPI0011DEF9F2|nr:DUF2867 domain-containing protein [Stappia sp. BW2]TYC67256.1 DUF2867 domain-containing protein [Stappia sp. BW2]
MTRRDKLPEDSLLNAYHAADDFLDTYSIPIRGQEDLLTADMRVLAERILTAEIGWVTALMSLRDNLVGIIGMKTTHDLANEQTAEAATCKGVGDRIGFFKIYSVLENEIILGENDWHQDFRLSLYRKRENGARIYASTCCKRHNLAGHAYLALILPFHKMIVKTMLARGTATP